MKTRRLLSFFFPLLLSAPCLHGAFSQKTAWDVQTGGSDLNGGGFDTSRTSPAVDRSQSAAPYLTFDGTGCTASGTNATPTVLTISGCNPAPSEADVGNVINITGGDHFVAGRYAITAQSGSTWTLDRNATDGTAATAMTGCMGGALATVSTAVGMFAAAAGGVADMTIYVKSGTYGPYGNISASVASSQSYNRLAGYLATHGDAPSGADRPVIQFTTGGGGNGFSVGASTGGWIYENLILDGNGTNTVIISASNTASLLANTTIRNSTANCFLSTGSVGMSRSEVTGCNGSYAISGGTGFYFYNWLHDNSNSIATVTTSGYGGTFVGNLFTNNSGGQGLRVNAPLIITNNTFYRQGKAAVYMLSSTPFFAVYNNLFACSGTYAIDSASSPVQTSYSWVDFNAYHANTSGTTHFLALGSHDVNLGASGTACDTNSPFVAAVPSGAGDWTLNNIAGAGTRLRAAGFQGPVPGMTTKGYVDIGAYQHADSGQGSCPTVSMSFPFVQ
jgi:hypothetical protein